MAVQKTKHYNKQKKNNMAIAEKQQQKLSTRTKT
jgi:hypothetical protein